MLSSVSGIAGVPPRGAATARATAQTQSAAPQVREAAAGLVSQMFFVPILQQMRELPFGKEFSHGGRGEEVFGEQLDQQLADIMARNDHSGLVDQVARGIARPCGEAPAHRGAAPTHFDLRNRT